MSPFIAALLSKEQSSGDIRRATNTNEGGATSNADTPPPTDAVKPKPLGETSLPKGWPQGSPKCP